MRASMLSIPALVAAATCAWAQNAASVDRPPNILLIMTDQQTVGVMGCSGNPLVKTPNLDRLAAQGARITQAICPTPFCSPTRASIRTGLWPHTHGIVYNVAPDPKTERRRPRQRPGRSGLSDKHTVLDNLLYDKGYAAEHLGKWHLGPLSDLHCYRHKGTEDGDRIAYTKWLETQGEGVFDRTPRPGETFVDESGGIFVRQSTIRARDTLATGPAKMTAEVHAVGRSAIAPRAQFETWLADRAMEWIQKHADRPFMLTFSVSPPHAPWIAPDPYYSMYDPPKMLLPASFAHPAPEYRNSQAGRMAAAAGEGGLREQLRCYYAQVTMMDEHVGNLLAKLHKLGLDDKTLVIFTSDHGDMQGAHGLMGKSAHAFYEEVVRVPLIFRYPPTVRAGQVLDMQVSTMDLMPTMLEYAGLPIPAGVQARSLRPLLDGKAKPDDRPAFCERILEGKLACRMIRTSEWKLCAYGDGRRELFHLSEDPGELKNLAKVADFKDQRERLEQQLREHMIRTTDPAIAALFPDSGS